LATPQQIKPKRSVARPYSRFETRAQSPNHEIPFRIAAPGKERFQPLMTAAGKVKQNRRFAAGFKAATS